MTSKARLQNKFLHPEFDRYDSTEGAKVHKQRQSTVYDAVAGIFSKILYYFANPNCEPLLTAT